MPSVRVARKRSKKVKDILRVANEVLSEKGYERTNLDEIAERLELTKASLYHYFDSKEALLTACLGTVAEEANERLTAISQETEGQPASERLRALIRAHLRTILMDYPHLAELFTHRLDWPMPYKAQVKKMREEHDTFFTNVIADGLASGEFSCRDADLVRHCIYGAINAVPVWFRRRSEKQVVELADRLTDTLLPMLQPGGRGKA